MRKLILSYCLLLLSVSGLWAQASSVEAGIQAYREARFGQAISTLAHLIELPGAIDTPQLSPAHFYLAQAYYRVGIDAQYDELYPQALLRAYNHLMAARDLDMVGTYRALFPDMVRLLQPAIYNVGVRAYNARQFEKAERYLSKTVRLSPSDPALRITLGYAQWHKGTKGEAAYNWERAMELMRRMPQTDSLTHQQARTLLLYTRAKGPQALELNPGLGKRLDSLLKLVPADSSLQLAYGEVLQSNGQELASLAVFEALLNRYPQQRSARKQLCTYWVNEAYELSLMPEDADMPEREAAIKRALASALPHLEYLHEAEPGDPRWEDQLERTRGYLAQ